MNLFAKKKTTKTLILILQQARHRTLFLPFRLSCQKLGLPAAVLTNGQKAATFSRLLPQKQKETKLFSPLHSWELAWGLFRKSFWKAAVTPTTLQFTKLETSWAFTTSALYAAVSNMVHNQAVAYSKL